MHGPLSALWFADIEAMEGDALLSATQADVLRVLARAAPERLSARVIGSVAVPHLPVGTVESSVGVHIFRVRQAMRDVRASFVVDGRRGQGNGYWMSPAAGTYTPRPPVSEAQIAAALDVKWSPMERRIMETLIAAGRSRRTGFQIADSVYADDSDGGPLTAKNSVTVTILTMRKKLPPGLRIASKPHHGYRLEVAG
jgi:DNA-binding response OmpR family regulator